MRLYCTLFINTERERERVVVSQPVPITKLLCVCDSYDCGSCGGYVFQAEKEHIAFFLKFCRAALAV